MDDTKNNDNIMREKLQDMYWGRSMSIREIAKAMGVPRTWVGIAMEKYSIRARSLKNSQKLRRKKERGII